MYLQISYFVGFERHQLQKDFLTNLKICLK